MSKIIFALLLTLTPSAFGYDPFVTYHCFFDDHLDNHKLVASAKVILYKNEKHPTSAFSMNLTPGTLPGHEYAFNIRYVGEIGKNGFDPVPLVEVSLYDKQKEIYSVSKGKVSTETELYTSFVNDDFTKIEAYCSTRPIKK